MTQNTSKISKVDQKINDMELISVNGQRFEWNETYSAYWSTDGDVRQLLTSDLEGAKVVSGDELLQQTPSPEKMDCFAIMEALANVEGPCTMSDGLLWLEDGTTLDIQGAAKNFSQYLAELRLAGYAIVAFTPDELGNADARDFENRLLELSSEVVADLQLSKSTEAMKG